MRGCCIIIVCASTSDAIRHKTIAITIDFFMIAYLYCVLFMSLYGDKEHSSASHYGQSTSCALSSNSSSIIFKAAGLNDRLRLIATGRLLSPIRVVSILPSVLASLG